MAYNVFFTKRAEELREKLADYLVYNLKTPQGHNHFYDCIDELIDKLASNPYQFGKCRDSRLVNATELLYSSSGGISVPLSQQTKLISSI